MHCLLLGCFASLLHSLRFSGQVKGLRFGAGEGFNRALHGHKGCYTVLWDFEWILHGFEGFPEVQGLQESESV